MSFEQFEHDLRWVRRDTIATLLVSVGIGAWLLTVTYVLRPDDFWPGWGTLTAMGVLICACLALKALSYDLVSWLFTGGLFAGVSVFLLTPGDKALAPFLFVLPVLIAGTVQGTGSAATVAAFSSAAIALAKPVADASIEPGTAFAALALVWLATLTSWAATRDLYTALHWAWDSSDQAIRNLDEARAYQGRLAAALRQLEDANYRLERANHALAWARAEAEEARRFKAQFAAHVSHELRTPINLIAGFADLMLHNPDAYGGASLPRPYVSDLAALHRSTRHLRGLIDDILDLSQLDEGEMPILREITDLPAVIHEAVATAQPLLTRKGLGVDVDVAPDLPLLSLDRLRIRQVLLNLLNNAARFTDHGGVSVRARRDGTDVVVEVRDTGIGIKARDLPQLFQPFHQVDSSPTRGRGGTGLGLAISKRFVELHGGRISASSPGVPGGGSTFTVALPVEAESDPERDGRAAESGARPHPPAPAPNPTVVVLHDDPTVLRLFQRRLDGYQVVGAASTAEAIEVAASRRAHALLADLPAEGVGAWHAEWSRLAEQNGTRVLGCPMPGSRLLARALGLVDYLVKPVTREALLRSVQSAAPAARKVLVVDDDRNMARLLCRLLESSGTRYRLRRAHSGDEALKALRDSRPDLVLLDLLMPQVGGLALLTAMRGDPELSGIPVVAVSAQGVGESIAPGTARSLVLIGDKAPSVSVLLRSVQSMLDLLPPAETKAPSAAREPPGATIASGAS